MKLLAVDDNPEILDVLPTIFRQAGIPQIALASSGFDALEILNNPDQHFDVLLLDITMPQMDGITLCKQIRAMPRYRNTPILMLTGTTESNRIEQAFAAGADDYITKPFDIKDMIKRVRVAQRMAKRATKTHTLDPTLILRDTREGVHPFAVAETVKLANAPKLITPFSLGNYLSQLSRRRLDNCSIFAVRMTDIGLLYSSAKTHEYAFALSQVIDAVSHCVDSPRLLMSYEGNGIFLCITQDPDTLIWPDVEDAVQERLDAQARLLESGWPMGLGVSIGNPVSPNASSNQRVKKTFERAIERATSRAQSQSRQNSQSRQMAGGGTVVAAFS